MELSPQYRSESITSSYGLSKHFEPLNGSYFILSCTIYMCKYVCLIRLQAPCQSHKTSGSLKTSSSIFFFPSSHWLHSIPVYIFIIWKTITSYRMGAQKLWFKTTELKLLYYSLLQCLTTMMAFQVDHFSLDKKSVILKLSVWYFPIFLGLLNAPFNISYL